MSSETMYHKGNDDCATPNWIRKPIFGDWYDPCPLSHGHTERDGLNSDWSGNRVFVNPPYSKPLPWVEKAIMESKRGKTIVLLLKHDSSTVWYAKLCEAGAHFLPILGRLHFNNGGPAPFPSILVVLSGAVK